MKKNIILFIILVITICIFSFSLFPVASIAFAEHIFGENYIYDYEICVVDLNVQLPTCNSTLTVSALEKYEYGTCDFIDSFYNPVPDIISYMNYYYDALYPNAQRLYPASNVYNCHSYAWYQQSNLNPYWIDDPSNYIASQTYLSSSGNVGDIICYYQESNGEKELIHSGIIVEVLSGNSNNLCGTSDLYIVDSKWGRAGVYRHRGDQCPYVVDQMANTVEFYTYHGLHSYTDYISLGTSQHRAVCDCGAVLVEAHMLTNTNHNMYYHISVCSRCGYTKNSAHNFTQVGAWYVCLDCGGRYKNNGPIPQPYGSDYWE